MKIVSLVLLAMIVIVLVFSVALFKKWHSTGDYTSLSQDDKLPTREKLEINDSDHIIGPKDAPVQVMVYSDFECPACLKYQKTIKRAIEYFGDKIVVAYRHYPLRFHMHAMTAAIASECAADQGKFWEMHDALFSINENGLMTDEKIRQTGAEIGLDNVKFLQCLDGNDHQDEISIEAARGKTFGVSGTPATFVNGRPLPGAYQFEDFTDSRGDKRQGLKSIIDEELNKQIADS